MRRLVISTILGALLLSAASSAEPAKTIELRVLSDDPEIIAQTDQFLLARFGMFNSATLTSVTSTIDGSTLTYSFPEDQPDAETIAFLIETTGLVTLALEETPDAEPIITSYDIERIDARNDGFGNELFFFELTPAAGELMLRTTADNIGKRLVMRVDDTVITEASIRGVFARQFQLSGIDLQNFAAIHAAIQFGPLPAPVEFLSIRAGS